MNASTEIKNKEDSLAALMNRLLKEPLSPLDKSIQDLNDALKDETEILQNFLNQISVLSDVAEKKQNRKLNAIKDQQEEILDKIGNQSQTVNNSFERVGSSIATLQKDFINLTEDKQKEVLGTLEQQSQILNNSFERVDSSIATLEKDFINLTEDKQKEVLGTLEQQSQILNNSFERVDSSIATLEKDFINLTEGKQKEVLAALREQSSQYATHLSDMSQILIQAMTETSDAVDGLNVLMRQTPEIISNEIHTSRKENATLASQSAASVRMLATNLDNATNLLNDSLSRQRHGLATIHQILIEKFQTVENWQTELKQIVNDIGIQQDANTQLLRLGNKISIDIQTRLQLLQKSQEASASDMEHRQVALIEQLATQNTSIATHLAAGQVKLKRLSITIGVLSASVLGHLGYDLWSKFS
jgi:hypothetical protein